MSFIETFAVNHRNYNLIIAGESEEPSPPVTGDVQIEFDFSTVAGSPPTVQNSGLLGGYIRGYTLVFPRGFIVGNTIVNQFSTLPANAWDMFDALSTETAAGVSETIEFYVKRVIGYDDDIPFSQEFALSIANAANSWTFSLNNTLGNLTLAITRNGSLGYAAVRNDFIDTFFYVSISKTSAGVWTLYINGAPVAWTVNPGGTFPFLLNDFVMSSSSPGPGSLSICNFLYRTDFEYTEAYTPPALIE